jgi:chromosome segregation ATPase
MATLVYSDVDGIDRSFSLGPDPVLVGRAAECAIRSDDPRVSRTHARIFFDEGSVWIEDLGSSNGVFVGPEKIKRALMPIGEIVLVGSLMLRLLPSSGTLPPPMGMHGRLAQWLEMERKARVGIEEERKEFARRVGELNDELRTMRVAHDVGEQEAAQLRADMVAAKKQAHRELEAVRVELAKARETTMVVSTQAGISAAEKLAEADMTIASLQNTIDQLRKVAPPSDGKAELTVAIARAEKAEKDLQAAKIRAQGAERNVGASTANAARAEGRAAEVAAKLDEAVRARQALETVVAQLREKAEAADLARIKSSPAEARTAEAVARADEAEKRASAADTMAKAMAKDVAEALKRAVDADARARAMAREFDGLVKRAEAAEERAAGIAALEARATEAQARIGEIERDATARVDDLQQELAHSLAAAAKAEALGTELRGQVEHAQGELAAERSNSMSLVDRETQLERELDEARTAIAGLKHRVELAEGQVAEYEVAIDQLEERIGDLETGAAVEQAASKSTLDDARAKTARLEEQLAEARAAAKTATKTAAGLEKRLDTMEQTQRMATEARAAAEQALTEAHGRIAGLEKQGDELTNLRRRLDEAHARMLEVEASVEPFKAKVEAADLAIGQAAALQRQLDEALQKLSWLERDQKDPKSDDARIAEITAAAEVRLREAEARLQALDGMLRDADLQTREARARADAAEARAAQVQSGAEQLEQRTSSLHTKYTEAEQHIADADVRAKAAESRAAQAEARATDAEALARDTEARAKDIEVRAKDIEARAKDAAERIASTERRARDAESEVETMRARTAGGSPVTGNDRRLQEAVAKIAALQREVDAAENVRQFAANTEREIAQLARDLREVKARLAQMTLERDRLAAELRDVHDDSETKNRHIATARRAPSLETTAGAEQAKYSVLASRAAELERKLADAEALLDARRRAHDEEPTNTGATLEFNEQINVLEESIDSLRANMRAASDETATMDQSDSVIAISTAVSSAAEHLERARDALRLLAKIRPG